MTKEIKLGKRTWLCPYCSKALALVKGSTVYPNREDLAERNYWYCDNGHPPAYVGCHKGTINPFGRAGDATLRRLKMEAHTAFDVLWKDKLMSRNQAYRELAKALDKHEKITHIGWFDDDDCRKTIVWANKKVEELRCAKS